VEDWRRDIELDEPQLRQGAVQVRFQVCPAAAAVELPIGAEVVEDDEAAFQEIRAQTGRLLVVQGPEPRLREIGNRILAQLRIVEPEHAAFVDMRIQIADFLQDSRQIELGTVAFGTGDVAMRPRRKPAIVVAARPAGVLDARKHESAIVGRGVGNWFA
jgi:hypothetical protein